MISNDVVMPLWLKSTNRKFRNEVFTPRKILAIRRTTVALIITFALGFHKLTEASLPLVNAGLLSLALLAQLAPALLGCIMWQRGYRLGSSMGITVASILWF